MSEFGWALVSGEYPPHQGGVAAYTARLAEALAAYGDQVQVFAPGPLAPTPGVRLHPLPRRVGHRALRQLSGELTPGARLLIQYSPHAFGYKAMNLALPAWISRHHGLRPWVIFHEVAYYRAAGEPWRHELLARVTQRMAVRTLQAAAHSFVTTPSWAERLHRLSPHSAPATWLPVPSNLPLHADAAAVTAVRGQLVAQDQPLLATMINRGAHLPTGIAPVVQALLRLAPAARMLLLGTGGPDVFRQLGDLQARASAPGFLPDATVAAHLSAADLVWQTYPDGISGRRGSAMAALALGRPLLTNPGWCTEPLWRDSGAVALAKLEQLPQVAAELLASPARLTALGAAGRQLYSDHFALERTVSALRSARQAESA